MKISKLFVFLVIGISFLFIGDIKAEQICKSQTHWYYFSLADHSSKEKIESQPISTSYSSIFSNSNWPSGAKIESVTTYKGLTKEELAMWFDMTVKGTSTISSSEDEFHHIHDRSYKNELTNNSSSKNFGSSVREQYLQLINTDATKAAEIRNSHIEKTYNAQIIPDTAEVTLSITDNGAVNGKIDRTYGGKSLSNVVPYEYEIDSNNPDKKGNVFFITAKTKVVLSYDCEEEVVIKPVQEQPIQEQPVQESVEPLYEEPNPDTGDFTVIGAGISVLSALATGVYAYYRRKLMI